MMPLLILQALIALIASTMPSSKADCSHPDWQAITSNPLKSGSDTIKSDPSIKLGAVQRLTNTSTYNGLKFMTVDPTNFYAGVMGLWAPGEDDWTVTPGFVDSFYNVPDYYLLNANNTDNDMHMLMIEFGEVDIVTQQGDSTTWVNPWMIYLTGDGLRYPQAQLIDNNLWVAVQDTITNETTILYQGENDSLFTEYGIPTLPDGTTYAPNGQYSMFAGYVDQSASKTLWFYYNDLSDGVQWLTYAISLEKGAIKLAPLQMVGQADLYCVAEQVSALTSADGHQAILFRNGILEDEDDTPHVTYTVIQLSSGPVAEICAEQVLKWGPHGNEISSNWSPALAPGAPFAGNYNVSMVWIDATDGTVNAITGNPW